MSAARRAESPLADQDVRDEFVRDLDVSFAIEAGAGTGKTTLIVDRIVAHVLRGDPIESIVAITFTDKAANELKTRVRRELEERRAKADARQSALLAEALRRVDAAPIRTIHSFSQSLLFERPVEARIDPGATLATESQTMRWRAEAFEAELEALDDDPAFATEMTELFAAGLQRAAFEALAAAVIGARAVDLADHAPVAASEIEPPFEELLRETKDLCERRDRGLEERPDALADEIDRLATELARLETADAPTRRRALFVLDPPKGGHIGSQANWRDKAEKLAIQDAVRAAHGLLEPWRERVRRHRAAVAYRFAKRVAARYESKKVEHAALDFDDLLLKTRDMLRDHWRVRREFAERYRTLIVDEFQDTDPLQAEIAFFLADTSVENECVRDWTKVRIGPGRLVLVGDPKQSIYGFRRADIEIYEAAKRVLEASGGRVRNIQVNFRSAAPILDFVNESFAKWITVDAEHPDEQPAYVALLPPPDPVNAGPAVVVLEEAKSHEIPARNGGLGESEASAVAAYLRDLVVGPNPRVVRDPHLGEARPARYSDVAILFKATTSHPEFEDALTAHGVPYRIAGGRKFFERVEVRVALALFRALDDPSDEVAMVALLRGPLFAIPDADLAEFVARGGRFSEAEVPSKATDRLAAAFERIRSLRGLRHGRSIAGFVEEALTVTRAHEIFRVQRGGESRSANLDKLVSIARSLERDDALGFRGFVDEVARRARDTEREADAEFLDESEDAVTLITMHSAKGLEWPIVCVAGTGRNGRPLDSRFVERGARPALEFALGSQENFVAESSSFEAARTNHRRRTLYERRRLLYVAMTRARDLLVLSRFHSPLPANSDPDADPNRRPIVDEYRDDPFFAGAEARAFGVRFDTGTLPRAELSDEPLRVDLKLDAPAPAETHAACAERDRFAAGMREIFARAAIGRAVTSATGEKPKERTRELDDAAPRARANQPGGTEFGSFVHAIFERLDFASSASPDPAVMTALAVESGQDGAAIEAATRLVATFLASPFAVDLARSRRFIAEAPFSYREGSTLVEGSIDLIAEREDGGLWIVDWKTDDVSGRQLDERFAKYRLQGETYRKALEAATGRRVERVVFHFLRSGESREVPVGP